MYEVIDETPSNFNVKNHGIPLVVLEDEYGGQSVIIIDDGCFVLMNGSKESSFRSVSHWYPEAATALASYLSSQLWERIKEEHYSAASLSGM